MPAVRHAVFVSLTPLVLWRYTAGVGEITRSSRWLVAGCLKFGNLEAGKFQFYALLPDNSGAGHLVSMTP